MNKGFGTTMLLLRSQLSERSGANDGGGAKSHTCHKVDIRYPDSALMTVADLVKHLNR